MDTNKEHQKHKTKSEKFNELLDKEILKVYVGSKERYGAPKIHMVLQRNGIRVT